MANATLTMKDAAARFDIISNVFYHIELDLSELNDTFRSVTTVNFDANNVGASSFIDLLCKEVNSVLLNGKRLNPADVYSDGKIILDNLQEHNELIVDATCLYSKTGEGLHKFYDKTEDETYIYTHFEPDDDRRVFASFSQPDIKGVFQVKTIVPHNWKAIANTRTARKYPVVIEKDGREFDIWEFRPTVIMPSYLVALCVGPFAQFKDELRLRDGRDIPLNIYVRKSLADFTDADELFEVTKQGFVAYANIFQTPYPYDKYDQVFCPEFNMGAMENIGCVTVTESYIFRARTSSTIYERRAITIIHELAHMWFGDLVTTKWWNDLWLNESFAEYMSYLATNDGTKYRYAWLDFALTQKAWAIRQDQLSTTHPVRPVRVDTAEEAHANFDGITYAKGGSILKQLVSYCGFRKFFTGIDAYFEKYKYSNATLEQWLDVLSEHTGKDLRHWAKLWIETEGVNTLTPEITVEGNNINDPNASITHFAIRQTATKEHPTLRPHKITIGIYDIADDLDPDRYDDGIALVRKSVIEADIDGELTEIPAMIGKKRGSIIILDDQDNTFAKIRFDEASLQNISKNLHLFADPLAQGVVWHSLFDMVEDGQYNPEDFIWLSLEALKSKTRASTVRFVLAGILKCVTQYTQKVYRQEVATRAATLIWRLILNSKPNSDAQLQFYLAFTTLAQTEGHSDVLRAFLRGRLHLEGIEVVRSIAWSSLDGLLRSGNAGLNEIEKVFAHDHSAQGIELRNRAIATIATAENKRQILLEVAKNHDISNFVSRFYALGFNAVNDEALLEPLIDEYYSNIREVWDNRSYEASEIYVSRFYPVNLASDELLEAGQKWLANNKDASPALIRLVTENIEDTQRALRVKKAFS